MTAERVRRPSRGRRSDAFSEIAKEKKVLALIRDKWIGVAIAGLRIRSARIHQRTESSATAAARARIRDAACRA
jgi:hypothetical protein